MDSDRRKRLENLALERLNDTADDDEQWSFLFRTDGAINSLFCPWDVTADWEFDGETEGLNLPWSAERLNLIKRGEAEPNKDELHQWRQAKCHKLADGSDWCWIAWIVPLRIDKMIDGYALFVAASYGDPDDSPILNGVFAILEEAEAALAVEGAVMRRRAHPL